MSQDLQSINEALTALRKSHEDFKSGVVTESQFKEIEAKTTEVLDKQEKANQEALEKHNQLENQVKDQKDNIDKLEKSIISMSDISNTDSKNYKNTEEWKQFEHGIKTGDWSEYGATAQTKANRTDILTQGGALAIQEFSSEIIKDMTEISPIRQFARVQSIGGKSLTIPNRTSIPTSSFEGETESKTDSNSTYGTDRLDLHRLTTVVHVTEEQMAFSNDFMSEVMADITESRAEREGNRFLNGTGVKQPNGYLLDSNVSSLETAVSNTLDFDSTIRLMGELKSTYQGNYFFHRATNAALRLLKGSDGQYLWQVQGEGAFNTLNGMNYVIDNQMPFFDTSSGASNGGKAVISYADMRRGYRIIDSSEMRIIRDDYTLASEGLIRLIVHSFVDGKVVQPEAIKLLKIKA